MKGTKYNSNKTEHKRYGGEVWRTRGFCLQTTKQNKQAKRDRERDSLCKGNKEITLKWMNIEEKKPKDNNERGGGGKNSAD